MERERLIGRWPGKAHFFEIFLYFIIKEALSK